MPLKLYKRGTIWHYRGTVAGRRLRGSTGSEEKRTAQRYAAEAEAREWRRHLDGPKAHVTMAQAAIAYRDAGKPTRFLEKIEDHWRDTPVNDVTPEMIRQSARLLYPGANTATWNRQVIKPTAAMINHAAALGWCHNVKVKSFPVNPKPKVPASREWCRAFADHASPHLGALCLFMFGTGARVGEAVGLRWSDVNLEERTATLRGDKPTPWRRSAHLPPAVVAAIANIPSDRQPDEKVFCYAESDSVKQPWANTATRAGIDPLTPHCCRHGFATTMLRMGVDAKTIAERGGWKDPATVLRTYAHALDDVTVTDRLFDTNLARSDDHENSSSSKERRKAQ